MENKTTTHNLDCKECKAVKSVKIDVKLTSKGVESLVYKCSNCDHQHQLDDFIPTSN